MIIIAVNYDNA